MKLICNTHSIHQIPTNKLIIVHLQRYLDTIVFLYTEVNHAPRCVCVRVYVCVRERELFFVERGFTGYSMVLGVQYNYNKLL